MNQEIENIIKKNLNQNRYQQGNCPFCDSERGITTAWGMNPVAMQELRKQHNNGHQALSQINTSLIADEVLKVIIRKIEEIETFEPEDDFVDGGDMEYASRRLAVDNSRRWGEIKIKTDILQLLSNLSHNKENK